MKPPLFLKKMKYRKRKSNMMTYFHVSDGPNMISIQTFNFNGGNRQNPSRDLSSQECTYYYADDRLRYMTCRPPKNSPSYSSPMIQRVRVDSSKMSSYTEARCRRPSCCKGELSGAPTLLKICWMRMRQVPMNFSGRQTKITKCDRTDGSKGNVFFAFVDKLDIIL